MEPVRFNVISNIHRHFLEAVNVFLDKKKPGPYRVTVSRMNFIHLLAVYTDGSGDSALSRLFDRIPWIAEVEVDADLPDTKVIMENLGTDRWIGKKNPVIKNPASVPLNEP